MPNWCSNVVTFSHDDHVQLQKIVDAFNKGELFNTFVPCPEDLHITAGKVGADDSPEQIELAAKEKANFEKYGFTNWYDWCVANWGTKWDSSGEGFDSVGLTAGDTSVTLTFDTAWSPPIAFFEKMEDEHGFAVKAYYYEPGMSYCGLYEDGVDDCYEIEGDSSWVEDHIPSAIDDMFAISESMSEWEQEQAEEEAEEDSK